MGGERPSSRWSGSSPSRGTCLGTKGMFLGKWGDEHTTKRNMSRKIEKARGRRRRESYTERELADTVNATRHRGMRFSSATRTSRNRYLGSVGGARANDNSISRGGWQTTHRQRHRVCARDRNYSTTTTTPPASSRVIVATDLVFYAMLYLKIAPFVPMFRKMEAMRIQKYISLDDRVEIRDEEEEGFGNFSIKNLTWKILEIRFENTFRLKF